MNFVLSTFGIETHSNISLTTCEMAAPAAPVLMGIVTVSLIIGFVALAWSSITVVLLLLGVGSCLATAFVLVCPGGATAGALI